jgi:hypothetical protein
MNPELYAEKVATIRLETRQGLPMSVKWPVSFRFSKQLPFCIANKATSVINNKM